MKRFIRKAWHVLRFIPLLLLTVILTLIAWAAIRLFGGEDDYEDEYF